MNAHQIVEAVLFASDAPLTAEEIARADEGMNEDHVEEAIRFLQAEYDDAERSFQIVMLAEGYQILTRPELAPYLERFDNVPRPSRLSGPALETLAIIAYRQPLGRIEIEYVRGVGCAGVLKTLLDREMIEVVGRSEGLGRPVLYGTSQRFLEHFGFRSLEDLPRPEELPVVLRERLPLGPEDEEEEGGAEEPEGAVETAAEAPEEVTAEESDGAAETPPEAQEDGPGEGADSASEGGAVENAEELTEDGGEEAPDLVPRANAEDSPDAEELDELPDRGVADTAADEADTRSSP